MSFKLTSIHRVTKRNGLTKRLERKRKKKENREEKALIIIPLGIVSRHSGLASKLLADVAAAAVTQQQHAI